MSAKTNIDDNVINRDYFQQPYRSSKSYADQMRLPTEKAKDAVQVTKEPESEFAQPYNSSYFGGEYDEMEYYLLSPSGEATPSVESTYDVAWVSPPQESESFNEYWGGEEAAQFAVLLMENGGAILSENEEEIGI